MKVPLKTPLTYQWALPIFWQIVEKNPWIDYEALRDLMRPYAKEYAIATDILQDGKDAAKKVIFGIAADHVCYAEGVVIALRVLGHLAELVDTSREQTLAVIDTIISMRRSIGKRKRKSLHLMASQSGRHIGSSGRRIRHYSFLILWGSKVAR